MVYGISLAEYELINWESTGTTLKNIIAVHNSEMFICELVVTLNAQKYKKMIREMLQASGSKLIIISTFCNDSGFSKNAAIARVQNLAGQKKWQALPPMGTHPIAWPQATTVPSTTSDPMEVEFNTKTQATIEASLRDVRNDIAAVPNAVNAVVGPAVSAALGSAMTSVTEAIGPLVTDAMGQSADAVARVEVARHDGFCRLSAVGREASRHFKDLRHLANDRKETIEHQRQIIDNMQRNADVYLQTILRLTDEVGCLKSLIPMSQAADDTDANTKRKNRERAQALRQRRRLFSKDDEVVVVAQFMHAFSSSSGSANGVLKATSNTLFTSFGNRVPGLSKSQFFKYIGRLGPELVDNRSRQRKKGAMYDIYSSAFGNTTVDALVERMLCSATRSSITL